MERARGGAFVEREKEGQGIGIGRSTDTIQYGVTVRYCCLDSLLLHCSRGDSRASLSGSDAGCLISSIHIPFDSAVSCVSAIVSHLQPRRQSQVASVGIIHPSVRLCSIQSHIAEKKPPHPESHAHIHIKTQHHKTSHNPLREKKNNPPDPLTHKLPAP